MRVIVERSRRVVVRCPVEFWRGSALVHAETEDISEHGAFVRSEEFFPRGHVLDLQFRMPDGTYARQRASVAHVLPQGIAKTIGRQAGMGFEFYGPTCEQILSLLHGAEKELDVPAPPEPRKLSILVADASLPLFERLATILEPAGHRILTATTGRRALEICRASRPDVALIDVDLEDMSAWELLDELSHDPALATLHVGVMGQAGDDISRLRAYRRGATDFIQKPFTDEEIAVRIGRLAPSGEVEAPRPALTGDLAALSLATLLSMFDFDHKSGTLCIERKSETERIFVADGRVVRVESAREGEPLRRLLEALDWTDGRFSFVAGEIICQPEIDLPTQQILLEHARVHDESEDGSDDEPDAEDTLDLDMAFGVAEPA